jgi:P-loop ATPase
MTTIEDLRGRLWSDEPSRVDFLAAQAIAETVSDAVLDDALNPLAIGLSGPWGSGKTTVLVAWR